MIFLNEQDYKDNFGIYLIRNNINKKVYVGQTTDRFIERYWNHKWKLNNKLHDNTYLQHSWDKYGTQSFNFEVICLCNQNNIEKIDDLERKYILQYKQTVGVYNIQIGGQDKPRESLKMSDKAKKIVGNKNRIHMTGKKATNQTKQKMSETRYKLGMIFVGTEEDYSKIKNIKEKLVEGYKPCQVSKILGIDYKLINSIYSNNAYKSVIVDGWNNLMLSKKPKYDNVIYKGIRSLPDEDIVKLKELYKEGYTINTLKDIYSVSRNTVRKLIKL